MAILVIAAANAVATAAIRPIQNAIIPSLARSPEELVAANVTSSAGEGLGVLIGPGFGGILLVFGTPVVAAAGAVGMALATVAFTQVRSDAGASTSVRAASAGYRHRSSLLAGIRAVRTLPIPALVMALFGLQPMVRGILTVLIVVASIELLGLGDPGVGLLNSAIGLGSILGSIGTVVLIGRRRLAPVFLLALVFWGLPIVVVGVAPVALVAVVAMGVVGVSNAVLDVAGYTVLQRTIPNHVRASVFGLFEGYVAAMAGLGGIVAPVLVAAFGVAGSLVVAGAILPVAVLVAARWALRVDDIALVPARQLALVRGVAMFAPLPITAIEELAASLEPLRFGPGETLMRAGEVGDRFILIDTGTVEVEADGAVVRTIGPGGSFGEIALLRGDPADGDRADAHGRDGLRPGRGGLHRGGDRRPGVGPVGRPGGRCPAGEPAGCARLSDRLGRSGGRASGGASIGCACTADANRRRGDHRRMPPAPDDHGHRPEPADEQQQRPERRRARRCAGSPVAVAGSNRSAAAGPSCS